jgi:hypothetical protein
MMVEPAGKYSFGKRGVETASSIVKAVAYEDIDSWRTEHLKGVIQANAESVKRGVKIQRVFILSQDAMPKAYDVLQMHKGAGIEVLVVPPEDLPSTELLESYMIVDDKILTLFFYTRDGKRFVGEKVSIEPIEVDRYISKFNSIHRRSQKYEPVVEP